MGLDWILNHTKMESPTNFKNLLPQYLWKPGYYLNSCMVIIRDMKEVMKKIALSSAVSAVLKILNTLFIVFLFVLVLKVIILCHIEEILNVRPIAITSHICYSKPYPYYDETGDFSFTVPRRPVKVLTMFGRQF